MLLTFLPGIKFEVGMWNVVHFKNAKFKMKPDPIAKNFVIGLMCSVIH